MGSSSRSAASGWRRRSTASCCARRVTSVATRSAAAQRAPASVAGPRLSSSDRPGGRWQPARRRDDGECTWDDRSGDRGLPVPGRPFRPPATGQPGIDRVIGVDVVPPPHAIGDAEFVRADIRNPMIGKIIAQADVDTVAHMNVIATPISAGGRVSQKEINVIGTMQLLAACQKAPGIRRLVVKSSAAVYGSSPRDPAMFTEDMGPKALPRAGFGKDSVEVEGYVRGFSRRRPDVEISMLRLANVIGPGISTTLTDYFCLPVDPGAVRLRRPPAVRARGRLAAGDAAGDDRPPGRHRQRRRRRRHHRPAGRAPGRPARRCPSRWRPPGCSASSSGAPGSPTSPHDQMQYLAFGRGMDTTRMRQVAAPRAGVHHARGLRGLRRPGRHRTAGPGGARQPRPTASPARPPAPGPRRCPRRGAPDGRSGRRADPRRCGRGRGPAPGAAAGRARRRRRAGQRGARPAPPYAAAQRPGRRGPRCRRRRYWRPRAPPAPPGGARLRPGRHAAVGRPRRDAARRRPPAPAGAARPAVRLGKAAPASGPRPPARAPAGRAARAAPPVRAAATGPDRGAQPTSPSRRPDACRPARRGAAPALRPRGARPRRASPCCGCRRRGLRLSGRTSSARSRHPRLPAPPAVRRLHRRRVRLRRGLHRARLPAAAAPALPLVVPRRGPRHREHPRSRAARWSWPTTPARSRWTR